MTSFAYKGRTKLDVRLRFLDYAVEADTCESVLDTLGAAIRKVGARVEGVANEDADFDDEIEIIENMLGVAYVACQVQINAVVQATLNIPDQGLRDYQIRALGPRFDEKYSKVEVLWSLANYFKHRDGWRRDTWVNPDAQSKWTVPIIKAVGLSCGSTGNLRQGAEALGNDSYSNVAVFHRVVRCWSADVRKHIHARFGR